MIAKRPAADEAGGTKGTYQIPPGFEDEHDDETRTISKTNQNPPAAPLPLRDETPPAVPVEEPVCTPLWANTVFGSVICAPGPAAPPLRPLWHEATDAISASGISRAAIPISFRIAHNWRAFAGCKLVFDGAVQAMIGKPVTLGERVAPASG
jgi:hypothetical protein